MAYFEVQITFRKYNYNDIYNFLYIAGITGFLEEEKTIKFFLNEDEQNKLRQICAELLKIQGIGRNSLRINKLENADWHGDWQKTIKPVMIKDRIIVFPSWMRKNLGHTKGKILVEIDPAMAFGTGHSETTRLILEMLCGNISKNDRLMLDYGCGTGIIAIACVKMGIGRAIAIDNDDDAILNASSNIRVNRVTGKVRLKKAGIQDIKTKGFDVVAANINADVIIKNILKIREKLKPGGKLFISGILKKEEALIIRLLKKHSFSVIDSRSENEWKAFYARKK